MSVETTPAVSSHAFALWRAAQAHNAVLFTGFPLHSCSVDGHTGAKAFRAFIQPYLDAEAVWGFPSVLDVGCGPQPTPAYLDGYPLARITGIDPLAPTATPHPFAFVQGYAEQLPWPAATFDLVLAATSLDHMLDPLRVLDEIKRVLVPSGVFACWVGVWEEAPRYDPQRPPAEAVDACHVFHLGPWFLDECAARFGPPIRMDGHAPSGGKFFAYRLVAAQDEGQPQCG